ncbi:MAG: hypothetical protein E7270_04035 [Lachnospiraceae bacterium]|nr:hypothetical protein [Lachnospiraceae bacterium]
MNNTLIFKLRENLNYLIDEGTLEKKFIVLFGMNTPGDEVINYLARKNYRVEAVVDNNPLNKGKKLAGVKVGKPEEVLGRFRNDAVILICSRYFLEMKKQLEEMGYEGKSQIYQVLDMGTGSGYTVEEKYFEGKTEKIHKAFGTYKNLEDIYGKNVHLILAPVKANGDVYIISSMLKDKENTKLAVIGGACKKIAQMFNLENVITITQEEMEDLVRLSGFLGKEISGIEVVQPYYMYTNIFGKMEGYKNLNFMDFFYYGYMKRGEEIMVKEPMDFHSESEIESIAKNLGIIKNKTYILAPYANSLPQVEWDFWTKLAKELKDRGFKVFTNSASDEEAEIKGTEKIFFDIRDTVKILEYAGGFIAMRNGLCEVASSSKCKQIIIYPDKAGGFAGIIDVYGIKSMGLSDTVIEIKDSEELLDKVLEVV